MRRARELAGGCVHVGCSARHAGPFAEEQAVLQVEQHLRPARCIEGIAVQRHALRGSEFDAHAMPRQGDAVDTGAGALRLLVEGGGEVGGGGVPAQAGGGHQQHVAQFRNPGAADARVREPQDAWRPELVAAAVAPAAVGVVRPRRHHAERHHRRRRGVAGAVGANEGIHKPGQIAPRHGGPDRQHPRQGHQGLHDEGHHHQGLHGCFRPAIRNTSTRSSRDAQSASLWPVPSTTTVIASAGV